MTCVRDDSEEAQLLAEMNADFEQLNRDHDARGRYDTELRDWDTVLLDGLEPDVTYQAS